MESVINHDSSRLKKGSWTKEEDMLLKNCVEQFGEGKWHLVPRRAGLNRCRKSCRLRWLNYLKPDIKKGSFDRAEVDLMKRLHRLLGNMWSLIAGRLPGRTANDVKNFWNAHVEKKPSSSSSSPSARQLIMATNINNRFVLSKTIAKTNNIIRPRPINLCKIRRDDSTSKLKAHHQNAELQEHDMIKWWNDLLELADSKEKHTSLSSIFHENEISTSNQDAVINVDSCKCNVAVDHGDIPLDVDHYGGDDDGRMEDIFLDMINLWEFSGFEDECVHVLAHHS